MKSSKIKKLKLSQLNRVSDNSENSEFSEKSSFKKFTENLEFNFFRFWEKMFSFLLYDAKLYPRDNLNRENNNYRDIAIYLNGFNNLRIIMSMSFMVILMNFGLLKVLQYLYYRSLIDPIDGLFFAFFLLFIPIIVFFQLFFLIIYIQSLKNDHTVLNGVYVISRTNSIDQILFTLKQIDYITYESFETNVNIQESIQSDDIYRVKRGRLGQKIRFESYNPTESRMLQRELEDEFNDMYYYYIFIKNINLQYNQTVLIKVNEYEAKITMFEKKWYRPLGGSNLIINLINIEKIELKKSMTD
jgi:hypothetical protein